MTTYNPAALAARNRTVEHVDDIIADIARHGHAIIPARLRDVIVSRLRKADVKFSVRKLDERRVKVMPKKE